ncbi:SDR family NAD(P)-dependent oxidoreductase [Mesobacterium pallidum]|uniref:SDR family NAD(P)-dependent oxidoreductase n=1 Tax=Mesobacterium pallidum TaxID=2872037 RepID=UPI001EE1BB0D|nr:SDR family oxidoreductase [Mesobacterium pallidum]
MAAGAIPLGARRALVTGGAGGIGWAIARALASGGCRVAIADLDGAAATTRATELGAGHVALPVDLTALGAARALVGQAANALGGLDIVVNNAGMTDSSGGALHDLPAERFDALVALNLTAVAEVCDAALGLLSRGGAVVNLASGASFKPLALRGPYSATKAGVAELTWALGPEARAKGINVTAVAPGYTRTPLVDELVRQGRVDLEAVAASIPMGRIATPEDIAEAVTFCTSPDAAALAGETLLVDGGGRLGAPAAGSAPTPGQGEGGHLLLGDPALATALGAETSQGARLAALTDARLLGAGLDMAATLRHLRDLATRCATQLDRASQFALTIVLPAGRSATERAATAAAAMLTRTLAREWAPAHLRVNAIEWRGDTKDGLAPICDFLAGLRAALVTGTVLRAGHD